MKRYALLALALLVLSACAQHMPPKSPCVGTGEDNPCSFKHQSEFV